MASERSATERIFQILRPYAANWSGTLGRGDLVIPQRDVPRVINDILDAIREFEGERCEATENEIFQVIAEARRRPSIQDEVANLLREFIILNRK